MSQIRRDKTPTDICSNTNTNASEDSETGPYACYNIVTFQSTHKPF